jgi:hypothetical protein
VVFTIRIKLSWPAICNPDAQDFLLLLLACNSRGIVSPTNWQRATPWQIASDRPRERCRICPLRCFTGFPPTAAVARRQRQFRIRRNAAEFCQRAIKTSREK